MKQNFVRKKIRFGYIRRIMTWLKELYDELNIMANLLKSRKNGEVITKRKVD